MKRVLSTIVSALVAVAFAGVVFAQEPPTTATHSPETEPATTLEQGPGVKHTKKAKKKKKAKKSKKAKKAKKSETGTSGSSAGTGTGGMTTTPESPAQPNPSKPGY